MSQVSKITAVILALVGLAHCSVDHSLDENHLLDDTTAGAQIYVRTVAVDGEESPLSERTLEFSLPADADPTSWELQVWEDHVMTPYALSVSEKKMPNRVIASASDAKFDTNKLSAVSFRIRAKTKGGSDWVYVKDFQVEGLLNELVRTMAPEIKDLDNSEASLSKAQEIANKYNASWQGKVVAGFAYAIPDMKKYESGGAMLPFAIDPVDATRYMTDKYTEGPNQLASLIRLYPAQAPDEELVLNERRVFGGKLNSVSVEIDEKGGRPRLDIHIR